MKINYNFTEKRRSSSTSKLFRERRSDMVIVSKVNQKDLYMWSITISISLSIVLIFLTIALMK